MTAYLANAQLRLYVAIAALAVASILFTLGFACAVPLAAFAAIAAMSFARREALMAIGAVWLANQLWGFAVMHYPTDGETLAWGAALGAIALLSCGAALLTIRRLPGALGAVAAFIAAFAVYQGSLVAIDIATGQSAEYFAAETVLRIFLINGCAFGGFWALRTILGGLASSRKSAELLAPRHI